MIDIENAFQDEMYPVMRLLLWEYYRLIFCCYKWKLVKTGKGVAGLVRIKS